MQPEILLSFIKSRRSVRKFKSGEIPPEDVKTIVDAARFAPSNSNSQPWKFVYIKDNEIKRQMKEAVVKRFELLKNKTLDIELKSSLEDYLKYIIFFEHAPAVIAVLCKRRSKILIESIQDEEIKKYFEEIRPEICSVSAAVQNMLLMLHSLGYGACWLTGPLIAKQSLEQILKITPPFELVALVPFGIPDERPTPPRRKDFEHILNFR